MHAVSPVDAADPASHPRAPAAAGQSSPDFAQLRRELVRAVERVCPSWLADRRDDLVQKSLLRVMRGLAGRGEGKPALPSSYLWKVAYSVTVDEIRVVRRREEVSLDVGQAGHSSVEPADAGHDPFAESARHELGQAIRGCLAGLPERRRMVVALSLVGHRQPEVARLVGWSLKTVENLLYRGLSQLRRCLTAKGYTP